MPSAARSLGVSDEPEVYEMNRRLKPSGFSFSDEEHVLGVTFNAGEVSKVFSYLIQTSH